MKRTSLIGPVIPDIKNPFCSEIREYNLILSITNNNLQKEEESILTLMQRRVDGIIINHLQSYTKIKSIDELQKENFPFVLLGFIKGTKANFVMADLARGAYLASRHLIELGHKKIVFMLGGNDNDVLRLRGYKKALREAGIGFRKNLIVKSGEEIECAR